MTGSEKGFLLLTSPLGNPERKLLSPAQLRNLGLRVQAMDISDNQRELSLTDLIKLGYGIDMAERILQLLSDEELLRYYVQKGKEASCLPLTQVSGLYPKAVFDKLGFDGPGSIWYKGDIAILDKRGIALVGSRELENENRRFAEEVGRQAAIQGYVLVSGNARGADKTAQNACLEVGGKVICVVADSLTDKKERENVLYLSEDGYDLPFSAQRALSRNRIIHSLGAATFVAQCGYQTGGTWSGTVKNLRFGWSPVYCFRDESPAQALLCNMGAGTIETEQLQNICLFTTGNTLFD